MNRKLRRHHIISAVMVTTLAAASGCALTTQHRDTPVKAKADPTGSTAPIAAKSPTPVTSPNHTPATVNANVPSITNGSATVMIAGQSKRFRSTVTDAAWSPDGSRLAYIDGNGNVATARSAGSNVRVLTRTDKKVRRAHPTWAAAGADIEFTERGHDGVWRIVTVASNGTESGPEQAEWLNGNPSHGDTAPNAVGALAATPESLSLKLLAYQHAGPKGPEVWIVDGNQREPVAVKVGAGSQPALAPDGQHVAFVGRGGQLFVETITDDKGGTAVQITFGVRGLSSPAWSPDGSRIAFRTSKDVESVSATAKSASKNPVRVESRTPGVPSYRPAVATTTYRLSTSDPIAAAIEVSRSRWVDADGHNGPMEDWAGAVTLLDTDDPTAAIIALETLWPGGPVLFVHGSNLDSRVKAEISRVIRPSDSTGITLVGTVSASIAQALTTMGYTVTRTPSSQAVMPDDLAGVSSVLVVSERDRAALADYRFVAKATNFPVLFVPGKTLSVAQRRALSTMTHGAYGKPTVYTLGSDAAAAVNGSWSGRPSIKLVNLSATDQSTESVQALGSYTDGPTSVALVSSASWQMQLIAAETESPVLVIDPKLGLSSTATGWLTTSAGSIARVYVFGDPAEVSGGTLATAVASVSGPAGSVAAALGVVK